MPIIRLEENRPAEVNKTKDLQRLLQNCSTPAMACNEQERIFFLVTIPLGLRCFG